MTLKNDNDAKVLLAKSQALEHLMNERIKLNRLIDELKEDYASAGDSLKIEIEKKAEEALNKLNEILSKLQEL